MDASTGTLAIALTFGLAVFLGIVLVIVLYVVLHLFALRFIMHLLKYISSSSSYLVDSRTANLPDARDFMAGPVKSRAPRVRRDPKVQAQAARAVARRRKRDRLMTVPRLLVAALGLVMVVFWLLSSLSNFPFF